MQKEVGDLHNLCAVIARVGVSCMVGQYCSMEGWVLAKTTGLHGS